MYLKRVSESFISLFEHVCSKDNKWWSFAVHRTWRCKPHRSGPLHLITLALRASELWTCRFVFFRRLATQGAANGSQIAPKGARILSNVYQNSRLPKGILGWCGAARTNSTHKYIILNTCNDIRNKTTEATRSEPMWSCIYIYIYAMGWHL